MVQSMKCEFTPRVTLRGASPGRDGYAAPNVAASPPGWLGIHWLRVTFSLDKLDEVRKHCLVFFGHVTDAGPGWWRYERRETYGIDNINLLFDTFRNKHKPTCCLDISGTALSRLGKDALVHLFNVLFKLGGRCCRIDVYYDDTRRIIEPEDINKMIDAHELRIKGFKLYRPVIPKNLYTGQCTGTTLYFGERGENGSGKFLRVYDKNLDPKDPIDCIRWELECSDKHADWLFLQLATQKPTFWPTIIGGVIGSCIDFFAGDDVFEEKNLDRLERLDDWQKIIDVIGEHPFSLEKVKPALEKSICWLYNSVSGTLAMLEKFFITAESQNAWKSFLTDVIKTGRERLSARHNAIVKAELLRLNMQSAPIINDYGASGISEVQPSGQLTKSA